MHPVRVVRTVWPRGPQGSASASASPMRSASTPRRAVSVRSSPGGSLTSTPRRTQADGSKRGATGLKQLVPVLLLVGLALYGMWFLRAATEASPSRTAVREDNLPIETLDPVTAGADRADAAESTAAPTVTKQLREAAEAAEAAAVQTTGVLPVGTKCEANFNPAAAMPRQKRVASFTGAQFVDVRSRDSTSEHRAGSIESKTMTLTAWVRLDAADGETMSIQTIAASKASGCEGNMAHYGVSMFVNGWNTNSGQLFISWGNRESGCEELSTADRVITEGQWTFVVQPAQTRWQKSMHCPLSCSRAASALGSTRSCLWHGSVAS